VKLFFTSISLLITLPIAIYIFIWFYNTISLYGKISDFPSGPYMKLHTVGLMTYHELLQDISLNNGASRKKDVNILIETKDLKQLKSNVPKSAMVNKKAIVILNNKAFSGKVRLRGDNEYHWLYPKTSWRFKSSKKNLLLGVHKWNFIIPKGNEMLNNQISYKLAKQMKLLVPQSKMVSLSVNNKFNGIKLMVEQIDEGFLRRNNRMPNDIYKGDNMGSKRILGVNLNMFNSPSIWKKPAYNNHYPADAKKPLESLLLQQNMSMLDYKSFAKFSAYIDLLNTYHHDKRHNWILYYDNYYEKMYPIVWDSMGWWEDYKFKDSTNITSSPLLKSLHRDYQFMYKKYYAMHTFFKSEKNFENTLDKEIKILISKMRKNDYTHKMDAGEIVNYNESIEKIKEFKERILKRIKKVKNDFLSESRKVNYQYTITNNKSLRLSVKGRALIKRIVIEGKNIDKSEDRSISYLLDGEKIEKSLIGTSVTEIGKLIIDINLLASLKIEDTVEFEEATYDIKIKDFNTQSISAVSLTFLDGKTLDIQKVNQIHEKEFTNVKNVFITARSEVAEIWSGDIDVTGFNLISKNIIIEPGTVVTLDTNASIKILGQIKAIGTKEKPIMFKSKDNIRPWNTVVLKDSLANGSVLKYCNFQDGSGEKGNLYEYTGMLSIHNVEDVLIENCDFNNSHRTDDMVHVIYSDVSIKNTKFRNSLNDALDVDISNIKVENCEFYNSGNDAIDLMNTKAIVNNTRFINSKDKAISIGEGSKLLAENNLIQSSEIGIQVKDSSVAYVNNTSFIQNAHAVDSYHKNWRYAKGGTVFLNKCLFEENFVSDISVRKKSKTFVNDCNFITSKKIDIKSREKIEFTNDKTIVHPFKETFFQRYTKDFFNERKTL